MDLNKICADVLAWAGPGCTCEIQRIDDGYEIRLTKDDKKRTLKMPDYVFSNRKASVEATLSAHARNAIYMLGQEK